MPFWSWKEIEAKGWNLVRSFASIEVVHSIIGELFQYSVGPGSREKSLRRHWLHSETGWAMADVGAKAATTVITGVVALSTVNAALVSVTAALLAGRRASLVNAEFGVTALTAIRADEQ